MFEKLKLMKRELKYYKETYLHKNGAVSMNGVLINYNMISTNKGLNWYLLDANKAIIGEVDSVHPGLLQHLAQIDSLIHGDFKNVGTITF